MATLPNPASLLAGQILSTINHLLGGQPWLRQRLAGFAGRAAVLKAFPVELAVSVGADGELVPAAAEASPDVVVEIPLTTVLAFATGDERARAKIEMSGDPAFAAVLGGVLRELRWDAEEDLSRVIGDVAARRIVQAGRSLLAWQRQAAHNLSQALAEYLIEEQAMLVPRSDVERWVHAVDDLREATERLEQRIARLDSARSG